MVVGCRLVGGFLDSPLCIGREPELSLREVDLLFKRWGIDGG